MAVQPFLCITEKVKSKKSYTAIHSGTFYILNLIFLRAIRRVNIQRISWVTFEKTNLSVVAASWFSLRNPPKVMAAESSALYCTRPWMHQGAMKSTRIKEFLDIFKFENVGNVSLAGFLEQKQRLCLNQG